MKRILWLCFVVAGCLALLWAQERDEKEPVRLPSGKLQIDEILKADHEQSLREVGQIIKLAEELKAEMEKNDRYVLSISALKKTEEIQKLARRIRTRIRRY